MKYIMNKSLLGSALFAIFIILGAIQEVFAQAGDCTDSAVVFLEGRRSELFQSSIYKFAEYADARERNQPSSHLFEAYQKINTDISLVNSKIQYCAEKEQNALAMYYFANESMRRGDQAINMIRSFEDKKALDSSTKVTLLDASNKEFSVAVEWYQKSSAMGVIGSMYELGNLYSKGKGLPKSEYLAVEWYNKAALKSLEQQKRDFAVSCLEKMSQLAPNHPLTLALTKKIYADTKK